MRENCVRETHSHVLYECSEFDVSAHSGCAVCCTALYSRRVRCCCSFQPLSLTSGRSQDATREPNRTETKRREEEMQCAALQSLQPTAQRRSSSGILAGGGGQQRTLCFALI